MGPTHKTKIVCTIGPASSSPKVIDRMIRAGMNVARLNFSHGDFDGHRQVIETIRSAETTSGCRVAIMADLPGPKIRIGELETEPIELRDGDPFNLTTVETIGDRTRAGVRFPSLPKLVGPGDRIYLNDGFIQLEVQAVEGDEVRCRVRTGGELRSRNGLNLPDVDVDIRAFTDRDRECLEFALGQGVDAVSQSFVATAADIEAVREAAAGLGHEPFVIAKLERAAARDHLDAIFAAADGIMVARGDLGVEIPIEEIAIAQKELIRRANELGRPVITATHMLESMCENRRPTRAEATDVANAILDGTDAVMLSGESAIGRYPVESVEMLARIAAVTEPHRFDHGPPPAPPLDSDEPRDLVAASIHRTSQDADVAAVIVPTLSGDTARGVTRFRLRVPVLAVTPSEVACRRLQFSYGVEAILRDTPPADWRAFARECLSDRGLDSSGLVLLAEGPSPANPERTHRMEILELGRRRST